MGIAVFMIKITGPNKFELIEEKIIQDPSEACKKKMTKKCYEGGKDPVTPGSFTINLVTKGKDKGCQWIEKEGYFILQGHNLPEKKKECYPLEEAKEKCIAAKDCGGIATQSNVCEGKYRVTHGTPTFKAFADWKSYKPFISYELNCPEKVCVC